MSAELDATSPSEGLQNQTRPDEEIKWVVERDMKTNLLGTIASSVPLLVFTLVFGFVAGIFVTDATGSFTLGVLAFLAVWLGPPGAKILVAYLNITMGGVEYAATDDRLVVYRETLTTTDTDAVPKDRVRDAEYQQDIWDKILGTGDIRIEGARGDSLYFENAPNGDAVLRAVREEIAEADTVDAMNQTA